MIKKNYIDRCTLKDSPCLSFDSQFLWSGFSNRVTGEYQKSALSVPNAFIGLGGWAVSSQHCCSTAQQSGNIMCAEISAYGWVCPVTMWAALYSTVKKAACSVN